MDRQAKDFEKGWEEIKEYCGDCEAWSGTDCTRNPITQDCLKERKQKQIEMPVQCTDGRFEVIKEIQDYMLSATNMTAEEAYSFAFRCWQCNFKKIPENAVVLTREEAVDLFNSKASGFMTSAIGDIPLNIDGMRKLVDEVSRLLIVQGELQDLNVKYYNDAKDLRRKLNNDGAIYSRLEVDGFIDETRKETAEKFAERLKTECFDGGIDDKWVAVCFSRLDEIAKEFTEIIYET
jgi:hypothetical protein